MISKMRIAAVLGAVVLLASACDNGGNPLSPSVRPALDGGGHTAGGNVTPPPSDSTGFGASAAADGGTTAPGDTVLVEGGGHTAGGN
jgi:hypothetical protein